MLYQPMNAAGLGQLVRPSGVNVNSVRYGGVTATAQNMRQVVRRALEGEQSQAIRRLGEEILGSVRPKDYVSEVAAIYYWVLVNLRYMRDPVHVEYLKSALISLQPQPWDRAAGRRAGVGDCDDNSIAIATLVSALVMVVGNRASIVTITTDPRRDFHHVFTVAKVPGVGNLVVDPVAGPNATAMLQRVARAQEYPVEPVIIPGRPGFGVAGGQLFGGPWSPSDAKVMW